MPSAKLPFGALEGSDEPEAAEKLISGFNLNDEDDEDNAPPDLETLHKTIVAKSSSRLPPYRREESNGDKNWLSTTSFGSRSVIGEEATVTTAVFNSNADGLGRDLTTEEILNRHRIRNAELEAMDYEPMVEDETRLPCEFCTMPIPITRLLKHQVYIY